MTNYFVYLHKAVKNQSQHSALNVGFTNILISKILSVVVSILKPGKYLNTIKHSRPNIQ